MFCIRFDLEGADSCRTARILLFFVNEVAEKHEKLVGKQAGEKMMQGSEQAWRYYGDVVFGTSKGTKHDIFCLLCKWEAGKAGRRAVLDRFLYEFCVGDPVGAYGSDMNSLWEKLFVECLAVVEEEGFCCRIYVEVRKRMEGGTGTNI